MTLAFCLIASYDHVIVVAVKKTTFKIFVHATCLATQTESRSGRKSVTVAIALQGIQAAYRRVLSGPIRRFD